MTTTAPITWQALLATLPDEDLATLVQPDELTAALTDPGMLAHVVAAPKPEPAPTTPAILAIATARVLAWPVIRCDLADQVGRFALVRYTPAGHRDPDLVICLSAGPAVDAYHAALRALQDARADGADWPVWYAATLAAAHRLIAPLYQVQPTRAEAGFVLSWALQTAAQGRRIAPLRPAQAPAVARPAEPPPAPTWAGDWPIGY